jgi:site-specific DNA-methyltransferase (adenine-specific)
MGKTWDSSGIAYSVELWRECLRVLKPGGHLLAFGGTRTWHRLAVAIEDSGFEMRDSIAWLYGSGFPKSHNISKAIDKVQGGEVKVGKAFKVAGEYGDRDLRDPETQGASRDEMRHEADTDDAKAWDGWGTALKPAHEPIVVARKPLTGTVAQNVLEHGVGGLNIAASRIGNEERTITITENGFGSNFMDDGWVPSGKTYENTVNGRWPANIILDEYTAELLDQQSGVSKSNSGGISSAGKSASFMSGGVLKETPRTGHDDSGGASRFFYVAKASKRDRNEGLDHLPVEQVPFGGHGNNETDGMTKQLVHAPRQNFHPTVKPTALMQYLIRLVTPANGIVLDPFAGSGSTGKAAILENKHFIGIELTAEYLPIIEGRLTHAYETLDSKEDLF